MKPLRVGYFCIIPTLWLKKPVITGYFASIIINDEEKRNVVTALIKEIEIYRNDESEYPLKRIGLNFPVFKDGGEVTELLWDKGNTVEVVLLLETGLRISEFCGLTTHIDMQNKILNIDHQLLKDSEIGYYIETPKTKNGKRELPLTERAYQAIQRILKNRGKAQPLIVGGYSNFLFLNREGLPKVAGNYEGMVRGLIKKYNKYHTDKLPNITPHGRVIIGTS